MPDLSGGVETALAVICALGLLGLLALALLPRAETRAHSGGMNTLTKAKPAPLKKNARRARSSAARRRAEDKADYEIAVKRCADLDAGRSRTMKPEEVWRELGLRD